jgi:ABC-type Fe3+ transport system substrate-binding protein
MFHKYSGLLVAAAVGLSVAMPLGVLRAAELPAGTQAALKKLKLDPSILGNIKDEVAVPKEWIDRAKAEPAAKIVGTWDPAQFNKILPVFQARYPGVKISYTRSDRYNRAINTLVALKEGRYIADVIVSFGRSYPDFKAADALADLRALPNFKKLGPEMRGEEGDWVGSKLTRRCLGYNTDRVTNASDLPKEWDDILTNPRWRNGRLAVINSYTVWLLPLWETKGEAWATNFLNKLYTEVKPQLRKEGENAALGLVGAGEYDAIIVASEYRTKERQSKGAPLGFHCPTPVPTAVSAIAVLKGSPSQDGAMIFTDWAISLEGQIVSFAVSGQGPTRPELQRKEFEYFPDEIEGKKAAIVSDLGATQEKVQDLWNSTWGQIK